MPVISSANVTDRPSRSQEKAEIEARHPGIAAADDLACGEHRQEAEEVQEGQQGEPEPAARRHSRQSADQERGENSAKKRHTQGRERQCRHIGHIPSSARKALKADLKSEVPVTFRRRRTRSQALFDQKARFSQRSVPGA
jgi:hypothetical protein